MHTAAGMTNLQIRHGAYSSDMRAHHMTRVPVSAFELTELSHACCVETVLPADRHLVRQQGLHASDGTELQHTAQADELTLLPPSVSSTLLSGFLTRVCSKILPPLSVMALARPFRYATGFSTAASSSCRQCLMPPSSEVPEKSP